MVRIEVLFLGPARDFAEASSASLEVPDGATIADLRLVLSERYPGLARALDTIRFAVNDEFADEETMLRGDDEVALIPPVSGGQERQPTGVQSAAGQGILVDLVAGPIPVDRIRSHVTGLSSLGAIVTFEGATRREIHDKHGAIVCLDYEAYEPMVRQTLQRLAAEAQTRFSAERVALFHRLGKVPPGEVSLMIAVACGHRAEGFEACRWLIDTLKKDVPVWKKEVFEDGHVQWSKG